MPVLEYRVFLKTTGEQAPAEWFNAFHFDCTFATGSASCDLLCKQLAEAATALHLDYVKVQRVAVFEYVSSVQNVHDPAPYVWQRVWQIAAASRAATEPIERYAALQLNKRTPAGNGGRNWFFHCLNRSDVIPALRGQWTLSNVAWFEGIVDFHFRAGLQAVSGARLVVPPALKGRKLNQVAIPTEYTLGHVVKAQRRDMMLGRANGDLKTTGEAIGGWAAHAQDIADAATGWEAQDFEFTPESLRGDILQIIGVIHGLAQKIAQVLSGENSSTDNSRKIPFRRWGQDAPFVAGLARTVKVDFEKDSEDLAKMQPYLFVDGGFYWHAGDTAILADYARKWANIAAVLSDFDWTTPYTSDAQIGAPNAPATSSQT